MELCECGRRVPEEDREICTCCDEHIGCISCMTTDDEGDLICDDCLKKCDKCSYSAGYDRLVKISDDDYLCPECHKVESVKMLVF